MIVLLWLFVWALPLAWAGWVLGLRLKGPQLYVPTWRQFLRR